MDLYNRFKSSGRSNNSNNDAGGPAQEMVSLTVRPTEEEYPDLAEDDEDDEGDALLRPKVNFFFL